MRHSRVRRGEEGHEEEGGVKETFPLSFMDDCVPRTVVIYEHYYRQIRLMRHSFAEVQGLGLKQPQSNV